jgi:hypothetical protein
MQNIELDAPFKVTIAFTRRSVTPHAQDFICIFFFVI